MLCIECFGYQLCSILLVLTFFHNFMCCVNFHDGAGVLVCNPRVAYVSDRFD